MYEDIYERLTVHLDLANETNYLAYISKTLSNYVSGRSVLEIAPNAGRHTAVLTKCNPAHYTVVESDPTCIPQLQLFDAVNVVHDDVYKFYNTAYPADVVVCLGLLYHLHSPIYLLELIVNQSNPAYIIIDNLTATETTMTAEYGFEFPNLPGNRYGGEITKKVAGINCALPLHVMTLAMRDLGYMEEFVDTDIKRFNAMSKFGFMVIYRNINHRHYSL